MSRFYDDAGTQREGRALLRKEARPGERNWTVLRRVWEVDRVVAKELCRFFEVDPMAIPVPKKKA